MIGYKRIVTTLSERLGNVHLTPAQGASAEVISVGTTHIVTSGIAGASGDVRGRPKVWNDLAHCYRLAGDSASYNRDCRRFVCII
jgi:phosphate/sulfate permease